jgi:hypothetical protein
MSEKLSVDLFSDDEQSPPSSSIELNTSPRKIDVESCEPPLSDFDEEDAGQLKSPVGPDEQEKIEEDQLLGASRNQAEYSRFVIVSWKIRQYSTLLKSVKSNTLLHQYKSDATLHSIISDVKRLLRGAKVLSVAFICHGNPGGMTLCHDKVITHVSIRGLNLLGCDFRKCF